MQHYLLDSNVLSDMLRNPHGQAARRVVELQASSEARIVTSVIVASEIQYGVQKKGSATLRSRVDQLFQAIPVLPLESGVEYVYADIRNQLESSGNVIGSNDMLIAAHALALDAILVTDNVREFTRVTKLQVENWVRPSTALTP